MLCTSPTFIAQTSLTKIALNFPREQLQEIIDLVTTPPRDQADLLLLSNAIDDFHDSLGELGSAVSRSLAAAALEIAKIAYPEGPILQNLRAKV